MNSENSVSLRSEFPKSFPNPSQNVPDGLGRFFYAYLCNRIPMGNKAVSVAPDSTGNHLAARLETPQMFTP